MDLLPKSIPIIKNRKIENKEVIVRTERGKSANHGECRKRHKSADHGECRTCPRGSHWPEALWWGRTATATIKDAAEKRRGLTCARARGEFTSRRAFNKELALHKALSIRIRENNT